MQGDKILYYKWKSKVFTIIIGFGFDTLDFEVLYLQSNTPNGRYGKRFLSNLDLIELRQNSGYCANVRGAEDAVSNPEIEYLDFLFLFQKIFFSMAEYHGP